MEKYIAKMARLANEGRLVGHGIWIDTYNCTTSDIAGTIYTRIDAANHYRVGIICRRKKPTS